MNPRDAGTLAYLADYSAMVGDQKGAFSYLGRALDLAPSNADVLFRASLVYNHFDDNKQTLEMLKKAVLARYSRTTIRDVPDFEPLHGDPKFQPLISGAEPAMAVR